MPTPVDTLRALLESRLKTIPPKVQTGGIQMAQRYKEWAAKAHKVLANRKAPVRALEETLAGYREFT